ncbi:MAG TPA: class I SAM-dependent methyltransferase [Saprospiraceae bacterium]|nr:class I SAM-dependent methyltransferase [Saprospiraceae bacterium]
MNVKESYNLWANQYDSDENKTRDMEAIALKNTLAGLQFSSVLELGCGTGKNTDFLLSLSDKVVSIDFSEEMLKKAKSRIHSHKVTFLQADLNKEWSFSHHGPFDLVTFSLVLEHIEKLDYLFYELNKTIKNEGLVYIGELHPFKQYSGSQARFENEKGKHSIPCFVHHVSDFTRAARNYSFKVELIDEVFDKNDRSNIPRLLVLVLRKEN